jgi:mannose-6-phosphate isomerase-like protein (cupin superfamily)
MDQWDPEDVEAHMAFLNHDRELREENGEDVDAQALELEKSGLGYQRVPPGYRFPYGHTHKKQEEVYVVLRGSGRMKLDDEIVELKEWDAVRVPRGTWRGYEAGPEGLEILVIGAPNLGEDPREDVDGRRDWWV